MKHGHDHHQRHKRPFDNGTLPLLVLDLIAGGPRHGYDLISELEMRTGGRYRPSPGAIYPILSRLAEDGFIATEGTEGKRKLWSITDAGNAFLSANGHTIHQTRDQLRGGRHNAPIPIREAMDTLKSALRASAAAGSDPTLIQRIADEIRNAAQKIDMLTHQQEERPMEQIITRHRHEIKRRRLTVSAIERLTPHMLRMTLTSPELADFSSLGFDDHIKLLFPSGTDKPAMRDYTPRRFDTAKNELVIDFAIHEAGPATQWAIDAKVGSTLDIGGPRGSSVIAPVFDWYLLIGDETALPAIGRRIEELPEGSRAIVIGAVIDRDEEQDFGGKALTHWVHRPASAATDPSSILAQVDALTLPEGRGFVWIAAEAMVARAVRDHVLNVLQHPKEWLKAAGYWVKGEADAKATLDD